ncbi:hypothetical protein QJQ45_026369 [Haematococcus lacustris]|nr:hypothetical protein QJQ45_026369 [Haematococcus lacustris]
MTAHRHALVHLQQLSVLMGCQMTTGPRAQTRHQQDEDELCFGWFMGKAGLQEVIIRMERSDAAAWENEEQRKSDYISFAVVQQELLANKSLALQSAMQQQINSAWELHASEHVACSYGPSPLQQVQHHEVEYIDIQHRFKLTVWQCTGCAACANPIRFHCWPSSQRQASIWYDISLLRHFMEAWFARLSEDVIRTLSADACLQPSSYAGAARATRHIKQHINTYLDPSGLEGDVLK